MTRTDNAFESAGDTAGPADTQDKQKQLFRAVLISAVTLLALNVVIALMVVGPTYLTLRILGPSLIGGIGGLVSLLLLNRDVPWAGHVAVAAFLIADSWEFVRGGLVGNEASLLMFLVPVILAGLLLQRGVIYVTVGIVLAVIGTVFSLESLELGTVPVTTIGPVLLMSLSLILLALFFDRFGVTLRDALVSQARVAKENARLYAESRRLNEELEQRVEQRTADLSDANRSLESFSYSVAHDLRAPLRSITGFSELLQEDYARELDEVGVDYLNRIRRSTERMGQIIDDLLSFSRVAQETISHEVIDLSRIAHEIGSEYTPYAPESLEFHVEEGLMVKGNPGLVRVAVANLISNAVKFSRNSQPARVEIGWDEEHEAFYIRDNGTGFDMQYAHNLFIPFQRLHGEEEFEGSGIGLPTVERIITRHGGTVWAQSVEGEGATFFFTLPLYEPEQDQPA